MGDGRVEGGACPPELAWWNNEEGLAEHGSIPSRSEASTSVSNNNTKPKTSVVTYQPIPSPLTCAHVSTDPEVASVGPVPVPEVANVGPVPRVANVEPVPDAEIAGPPQHDNATGHIMDSHAEDLTAPWTDGMTSMQCMHESENQVYNAALGSTGYVSGGAVGKIDLTYPWQHGIERCNECKLDPYRPVN